MAENNTEKLGSVARVQAAANAAGMDIEIRRMGESTRTAEEAARQCGCATDQIVKSLVFQGADSGGLFLLLAPGSLRVDMTKAAKLAGESLERADPRLVRSETGFAIGGVAPIGHLAPVCCLADQRLLQHGSVWAAAGAHDAVFHADTKKLLDAANARIVDICV